MPRVSLEQARQSRLYGVSGWLLILYVLAVMSVLPTLSRAFNDSYAAMLELNLQMEFGTTRLIELTRVALALPFLVLTPLKHRLMPPISIVCAWLSVALTVGLYLTISVGVANAADIDLPFGAMGIEDDAALALQSELKAFQASLQFSLFVLMIGVPVASAAIFTGYLLMSERVNVTFRHQISDFEARYATFGDAGPDSAAKDGMASTGR